MQWVVTASSSNSSQQGNKKEKEEVKELFTLQLEERTLSTGAAFPVAEAVRIHFELLQPGNEHWRVVTIIL